jgi:SAM-dependent methyltransferase
MAAIADLSPRRALPPVATAALIHGAVWAGLLTLSALVPFSAALPWPWIEGSLAAALGRVARLPRWWLPINFAFFPLLLAALELEVPPGFVLAAFLLVYCFNSAAWRQRVPLFASGSRTARQVAGLLPHRRNLRVVDLGCGAGGLLRTLSATRPDGVYHGVELSPLPYLAARVRAWLGGGFSVRWGDFWLTDLSGYDVVYAYLSPEPMERLWEKALREMPAGSLFISKGFAVPGAQPSLTLATGERMDPTLYVWRM